MCGEFKQPEYFHTGADGKSTAKCKVCYSIYGKAYRAKNADKYRAYTRKANLVKKYKITTDDYDFMLDEQGGVCAICGRRDSGRDQNEHFCVDHCHNTGRVRGLLCHRCNVGIGHFDDDPHMVRSALEYLVKTPPDIELIPIHIC